MSLLEEIAATKLSEIESLEKQKSLEEIKKEAKEIDYKIKNFTGNWMDSEKLHLIAEVKRKSPSKGIIRENFNPKEIAKSFIENGASAISILTDEKYFGGNSEYFKEIRKITDLPLLRKDFIIDPYQIYETKILEADIILLIVKCLQEKLSDFVEISLELGLNILIEVHNQVELEQSLRVINNLSTENQQKILLGINNRNLENFVTDIQTSLGLIEQIPGNITTISESGIHNTKQVEILREVGFKGVLIGEGLAKNEELINYFQR